MEKKINKYIRHDVHKNIRTNIKIVNLTQLVFSFVSSLFRFFYEYSLINFSWKPLYRSTMSFITSVGGKMVVLK